MLFAAMETADMISAGIGAATVCFTVVCCTWKISGRISSMESALKINTTQVNELHDVATNHAKECDMHRVAMDGQLQAHEKRLDSHSNQLDVLHGQKTG